MAGWQEKCAGRIGNTDKHFDEPGGHFSRSPQGRGPFGRWRCRSSLMDMPSMAILTPGHRAKMPGVAAMTQGEIGPQYGPEQFAAEHGVSRETLALLQTYVDVLTDWNSRHNLVSDNSLARVWHRHIADSAQLVQHIPVNAWTLTDLGSGAGFPGLVLAAMLREQLHVTLYESVGKKCDFLRAAAEAMGLKVSVLNERAERASQQRPADIVTARAMAPLAKLLGYAQHFWGKGTTGLFLKGQNVVSELTEARISWNMEVRQHPSLTDPSGVVLEIRTLSHVQPEKASHHGGRQSKGRRR